MDGIIREAKEEAGITVSKNDLNFVHVSHRLSRGAIGQERIDLFFECSAWDGEVENMEPGKCDDLSWFHITDLPEAIIPLIRHVVAAVNAGKSYSEYTVEP